MGETFCGIQIIKKKLLTVEKKYMKNEEIGIAEFRSMIVLVKALDTHYDLDEKRFLEGGKVVISQWDLQGNRFPPQTLMFTRIYSCQRS